MDVMEGGLTISTDDCDMTEEGTSLGGRVGTDGAAWLKWVVMKWFWLMKTKTRIVVMELAQYAKENNQSAA